MSGPRPSYYLFCPLTTISPTFLSPNFLFPIRPIHSVSVWSEEEEGETPKMEGKLYRFRRPPIPHILNIEIHLITNAPSVRDFYGFLLKGKKEVKHQRFFNLVNSILPSRLVRDFSPSSASVLMELENFFTQPFRSHLNALYYFLKIN